MSRFLYDIIEQRNAELASQYEQARDGPPPITYIPTGIQALDDYGLLEPGILTVIMAHPGDGKTSVALQLLRGAVGAGFTPRACLYEDPLPLVADRLTAGEMGESAFKLRRLKLDDENISARLHAATEALDWTRQVIISERSPVSEELEEELAEAGGRETGLLVVDYAQAFDAEKDEKSVERVIARIAWSLSLWAKQTGNSAVLFSQVKNEVIQRGRKWFDNWKFNQDRAGNVIKADPAAVEGFRPKDGDAQWSTALYQRAKDFISVFRPGNWLNKEGIVSKDEVIEFLRTKGNYAGMGRPVRCKWDGSNSTIS